jgi:molybdopterin synthase sulfur carrier subunit
VRVEVRYFASLREAVRRDREQVDLPLGVTTAGALRGHLRERGGVWADAFADGCTLRLAVDRAMAAADTALRDGAEVAFFPPVTGG